MTSLPSLLTVMHVIGPALALFLCHHRYVVAGLGGEAPDDFGGHHVMEC